MNRKKRGVKKLLTITVLVVIVLLWGYANIEPLKVTWQAAVNAGFKVPLTVPVLLVGILLGLLLSNFNGRHKLDVYQKDSTADDLNSAERNKKRAEFKTPKVG